MIDSRKLLEELEGLGEKQIKTPEYVCENFNSFSDLTDFLNDKKIQKSDIVNISMAYGVMLIYLRK